MPKDKDKCNGCNYLYYSDGKVPTCDILHEVHPYYMMMTNGVDKLEKPTNCPIREFPKENDENYFPDEFLDGIATGWNMCLKKIKGEEMNF